MNCFQMHLARYAAGHLNDAETQQPSPDHCHLCFVTSTHSDDYSPLQSELADSWLVETWVAV